MTGCGRSEFSIGDEGLSVEVKSLNHRYLDARIRVPDRFFGLENRVREELKKRFSRGSFTLVLYSETSEYPELKVNLPAAKVYLQAAEDLKRELNVGGEVDIELLMRQKDVFTTERRLVDVDAEWKAIEKGLNGAFDELEDWRTREGKTLEADLRARLNSAEGL